MADTLLRFHITQNQSQREGRFTPTHTYLHSHLRHPPAVRPHVSITAEQTPWNLVLCRSKRFCGTVNRKILVKTVWVLSMEICLLLRLWFSHLTSFLAVYPNGVVFFYSIQSDYHLRDLDKHPEMTCVYACEIVCVCGCVAYLPGHIVIYWVFSAKGVICVIKYILY